MTPAWIEAMWELEAKAKPGPELLDPLGQTTAVNWMFALNLLYAGAALACVVGAVWIARQAWKESR